MNSKIKKIAFNVYPVKEMARSRAFFENLLGLKPGEDFQGSWQEYDFGGSTFAISTMLADSVKPGTQGSVAFEVDDLDGLVKELSAKGVQFALEEKIMESPVCRISVIKDPDGNTIALHQVK